MNNINNQQTSSALPTGQEVASVIPDNKQPGSVIPDNQLTTDTGENTPDVKPEVVTNSELPPVIENQTVLPERPVQTSAQAVKLRVKRADCQTPHTVSLIRNEAGTVTEARINDVREVDTIGAKTINHILQEAGREIPPTNDAVLEISFSPQTGGVMVVTSVTVENIPAEEEPEQ